MPVKLMKYCVLPPCTAVLRRVRELVAEIHIYAYDVITGFFRAPSHSSIIYGRSLGMGEEIELNIIIFISYIRLANEIDPLYLTPTYKSFLRKILAMGTP